MRAMVLAAFLTASGLVVLHALPAYDSIVHAQRRDDKKKKEKEKEKPGPPVVRDKDSKGKGEKGKEQDKRPDRRRP